MQPIRLGLVGCGLAATNLHWPALQKLQDRFQLVMVCDTSEQRAKEFSALAGNVPYVTDPSRVLENLEIEAVDVVLPIQLHNAMAHRVLEAGKHLFVEKPLAGSLKEARQMSELEGKYPLVKMVGENFRYRKALARVRQLLDAGSIGAPLTVFCNLFAQFDVQGNPYAQTPWRRQNKFAGGIVTDVGIHYAAQLRFIFGNLRVTGAFCQSFDSAIGAVDSISFQFTNSHDLRGVMNLFLGARDCFQESITVLGREGTLMGGQHGSNFGDFKLSVARDGKTTEEVIQHDTGIEEEFVDFHSAIRGGTTVKSSFAEAYQDLKFTLDALQSAQRAK